MTGRALVRIVLPLLLAALALWQLERPRAGLQIETLRIGTTPATLYSAAAEGPLVVVAHGFAGSRQIMQAYSLTLARAGYRALAFDFEGHGRNPVPMSGDVTEVAGTTQRLVDQTLAVVAAGRDRTGWDGPVALLGHSMATDVIVRAAAQGTADENAALPEVGAAAAPQVADIGPVVAISMFSQAVTSTHPKDLLMITGQWEPPLRRFAREAMAMVDPEAGEGETARAGDVRRRAVVAPYVEHVGVLYSPTGLRAAVDWLDAAYGRATSSGAPVAAIGPWLVLLLGAIVALTGPAARLLPARAGPRPDPLPARSVAALVLGPGVLAPLVATRIDTGLLPVLVADYLMVHLAVLGALQLAGLAWLRVRPGPVAPLAALALAVWGLGVFGLALDRFGANFVPDAQRLTIIAVLCAGAVPFMLADALLTAPGRAGRALRLAVRAGFLGSLGLAVALDFERLFFLVIIAPVLVLFYLTFGVMGRAVARRAGPAAAGLALGVVLAWALGVTFPLFAPGAAG